MDQCWRVRVGSVLEGEGWIVVGGCWMDQFWRVRIGSILEGEGWISVGR